MVSCKICGHQTANSLQAHLAHGHGINNKEYLKRFPGDLYKNLDNCLIAVKEALNA